MLSHLCIWLHIVGVATVLAAISKFEAPSKCYVYLTVSLGAKRLEESLLEINWGPNCRLPTTWIGLFNQNPSVHDLQSMYTIHLNDTIVTGSVGTNTAVGQMSLPDGWDRDAAVQKTGALNGRSPVCLPFYVAAFNERNEITSMDCWKMQPNWMANIPALWEMPLKDIFLPGTHGSGSFPSEAINITPMNQQFGFSQNFDIWTQLVMGIRHLNLHIGSNTTSNTGFWIMNENLYINPLTKILPDIRQFVRLTGELVVLDVRDFSDSLSHQPERHRQLVKLIESQLGDYAFGRNHAAGTGSLNSYDLTMKQMREQGRMILITYNEPTTVKENKMLWTPWQQFSTKNLERSEYLDFLNQIFRQQYDIEGEKTDVGWSLVAIQSLESAYNSNRFLPSQKQRAAEINRNVTAWIGGIWSQEVNVVSMDYVWSTNLIDLAIYTNSHKHWSPGSANFSKFEVVI